MAQATRVPEILDALYNSWSVDPLITELGDSCTVYDGPFNTDLSSAYRLFVGGVGTDDDEDPSVTETQTSPHATDISRDFEVSVRCAAWYVAGDQDARAARNNATDLLNRAVAMPRATQNLGLLNIFYVGFDDLQLRQVAANTGAAAIWTFTVVVRGRIYS